MCCPVKWQDFALSLSVVRSSASCISVAAAQNCEFKKAYTTPTTTRIPTPPATSFELSSLHTYTCCLLLILNHNSGWPCKQLYMTVQTGGTSGCWAELCHMRRPTDVRKHGRQSPLAGSDVCNNSAHKCCAEHLCTICITLGRSWHLERHYSTVPACCVHGYERGRAKP